LPGYSGLDILQGLKKIQPETPVVVITEGEDAYSQVFERGANAYLGKPIQLETLRKLIQEMIPRRVS